jgi:hypothetical protein
VVQAGVACKRRHVGNEANQTAMDETTTTAETANAPELQRELPNSAPGKVLSPAARRALEEAAARKAEIDARSDDLTRVPEVDGRGGLEPVRYNDWEIKGLTSDF